MTNQPFTAIELLKKAQGYLLEDKTLCCKILISSIRAVFGEIPGLSFLQGSCLEKCSRFTEAEDAYNKELQLFPNDHLAKERLDVLKQRKHKFPPTGVRDDQGIFTTRYTRQLIDIMDFSSICLLRGNYRLALTITDELDILGFSRVSGIYHIRAYAYMKLEEWMHAVHEAYLEVNLDDHNTFAMEILAETMTQALTQCIGLINQGDIDLAMKNIDTMISFNINFPNLYFLKSVCCNHLNKIQEAEFALKKELDLYPSNRNALDEMTKIQMCK